MPKTQIDNFRCKYCENVFVVPDGEQPGESIVIQDDEHAIEIDCDNGFLYAFCKCGRKVVTTINYCPMCGRKLDDKTAD